MKKIFWFQLNNEEKLKRFYKSTWLLFLAVICLFWKCELHIAVIVSLILIVCAVKEVINLKKKINS